MTEKIVAFAPIARPRDRIAMAANPRLRRSCLKARPRSFSTRLRLLEVAVPEPDDARAVGGVRFRMRDLHDRCPLIVQALEQLHDFLRLRRMEVASGSVTQGD